MKTISKNEIKILYLSDKLNQIQYLANDWDKCNYVVSGTPEDYRNCNKLSKYLVDYPNHPNEKFFRYLLVCEEHVDLYIRRMKDYYIIYEIKDE